MCQECINGNVCSRCRKSYIHANGSYSFYNSFQMYERNFFYHKNGRILNHFCYCEKSPLHRVDGPAVIRFLRKSHKAHRAWKLHGVTHRIGGPAVEFADGEQKYLIDDWYYMEWEYYSIITSILKMSRMQRFTDPRWWVREITDDQIDDLDIEEIQNAAND